MATPFPFGSGNTLLASQLNAITTLPINDQTASYVAVVGDVGKRIVMNVATANTVTINNSVFAVGDTIFIANKGAGASTITAGAGVTINTSGSLALAQHGGGTLVALSASVFTFFSGGVPVISFDYLVIAGGAGGGSGWNGGGGGGGAGGYFTSSQYLKVGDSFTVTVGAGGASNVNGSNSVCLSVTTIGGGAGGFPSQAAGAVGVNGGSGGGGSAGQVTALGGGSAIISTQGFAGGAGIYGSGWNGGGGGGAGAVGVAASNAGSGIAGNGGAGLASSITGSSIFRGGGGGGKSVTGTQGTGGNGGGGTGNTSGGTANTGGGAGCDGGSGGSGVVIIRYPDTFPDLTSIGGGLTYAKTTPTGYKVYSFTAGTGTVTV